MKETRQIMGMPVTVAVADPSVIAEDLEEIFTYFVSVDQKFSTYKKNSEISRFNDGKISEKELSQDAKEILRLAKDTKDETNGYFDIKKDAKIDPSGIVKGWAIYNASLLLKKKGFKNFYIDAGGDIQAEGKNFEGNKWRVGIRNPFKPSEYVKVLSVSGVGVATSGIYNRGQHIYDPHKPKKTLDEIASLTVIAPTVYDADRFATAAFAMGEKGIGFIQSLEDTEGYMIDTDGTATFTSDFDRYVARN